MLEFNPYFRPTASQLLENPVFDKIRSKENEIVAQKTIKLQMDLEKYAFDYGSDGEEPQDNLELQCKFLKLIIKESIKISE